MNLPAEKPDPAAIIREHSETIAVEAVERDLRANPMREKKCGDHARVQSIKDAKYHLSYLAEAVDASDFELFTKYVAWVQSMLEARSIPAKLFKTHLQFIGETLKEHLTARDSEPVLAILTQGIHALDQPSKQISHGLANEKPLGGLASQYLRLLLEGKRHLASRLILDSLKLGLSIREIYLDVFTPVQREIGCLWQINRISVAQEHFATAATQLIMSQTYDYVFSADRNGRTLVATCVAHELHEIGLRMVADFFEMEGWNTYYLGASMPHLDVVRSLIDFKADALAISATITPHLSSVRDLIRTVRNDPKCSNVKIMVGGYPFNVGSQLWQTVGADGYAPDAPAAVLECEKLLEVSR